MAHNNPKSKRMTLHQKYKVERRVKEHHRKQRKEAKKNALSGHKKLHKDPGIPNLHPFKEQILAKLEDQKKRDDQDKLQLKQRQKKTTGSTKTKEHEYFSI